MGLPTTYLAEEMTEEDLVLHRKCQNIMFGVETIIGNTSMNPEITLQLRQNTKEMCELKYDMQNLTVAINSLKGLELTHIKDKFKRQFSKLNHAAKNISSNNENMITEFQSVRKEVENFEMEMLRTLNTFQ